MVLNLPGNDKIITDIVSNAKKIRGEVISQSLDVEFILNEFIGLFFIKDDTEQIKVFNECILQKEFFTFGEKLKVFNYLLTNYPEKFHLESDEKRKEIITAIREVMEYRNKIAHEEIVVNFKEKKAFILNKNGENLLSPECVKKYYSNIYYLSLVHFALYTNLAIETSKESNKQS